MSGAHVWLAAIWIAPLSTVAAGLAGLPASRLRRWALASAVAMTALGCLPAWTPELRTTILALPAGAHPFLGQQLLRVGELSSALLPLPAALWWLTLAATPRSQLHPDRLPLMAIATLATTSAFMTSSPAVLLLAWTVSAAVYVSSLSGPGQRRVRRVAVAYLGTSTVLFTVGVLLWSLPARGFGSEVGLWCVAAAVLIRKGIVPFHAWIPEVLEHGRLGPAVLLTGPQLGAYVAAVLVVPHADSELLRSIAALSLWTALHAALLSIVQRDARRACGYLFVSQSALVMAGLDSTDNGAVAGALVLWVSSALTFTAIARCVLVLEARRGKLDLARLHGGYAQMPWLANAFLVLGLGYACFPGTIGFTGQELLVKGAMHAFPVLGLSVVVVASLTGFAILRMYFSLFCGRPSADVPLPIARREASAFALVATCLVVLGLAPGPLVDVSVRASVEIREWSSASPVQETAMTTRPAPELDGR